MSRLLSRSFATVNGAGKKIAFVGLGNMGLPMAQNCQKAGFDVVGYDIGEIQKKAAKEANVPVASSIKDAVSDVDYVVTCLPKTEHVETVLKQTDGIFESASKGTYICDVSTISPVASSEFYEQAAEHGMTFLDTPMSGGITGAKAGTLCFMVGADTEKEYEHARSMLMAMGANSFYCGKPGSGEIAKLCNNLILGINMISTAEGFAIGEKLGMNPKLLSDIVEVSSGNSWCVSPYNPRPGNKEGVPSSRNWEGGFQVALIKKDMALAMEAAKAGNANTDMADFAIKYYADLEKKGYGTKDLGFVWHYIMKNKKL